MQNLDNNMNDLFRKASDLYEPELPDSDWASMATRLSASSVTAATPVKKRSYKKIAALLLLFAFLITGYFYQHPDVLHAKKISGISGTTGIKNSNATTEHVSVSKEHNNQIRNKKNSVANSAFLTQTIMMQNKLLPAIHNPEMLAEINLPQVKGNFELKDLPDITSAYHPENSVTKKQVLQADSTENKLSGKNIPQSKEKKFYLGVLAGTSFNQIQQQGYKKAGFDIGLLAGYKLNKKLSVEATVLYASKYYYSDGKYFNMDKMPANMKVINLKGCSNVFEIPVVAKYDLVKTKKAAAFVTAGVSSYILTKENNDYIVQINGAQQKMKGLYKNISTGLASSFHLGFGYEQTLLKNTNLRLEPYVNLPVKGIGIGNMRVMSAGVHVVATLPVH